MTQTPALSHLLARAVNSHEMKVRGFEWERQFVQRVTQFHDVADLPPDVRADIDLLVASGPPNWKAVLTAQRKQR